MYPTILFSFLYFRLAPSNRFFQIPIVFKQSHAFLMKKKGYLNCPTSKIASLHSHVCQELFILAFSISSLPSHSSDCPDWFLSYHCTKIALTEVNIDLCGAHFSGHFLVFVINDAIARGIVLGVKNGTKYHTGRTLNTEKRREGGRERKRENTEKRTSENANT